MAGLSAGRDLGRFIKRAREDRGIDQERFAELMGWSGGTQSRVERGQRALRTKGEVMAIAKLLGLNEDDLRAGVEAAGAGVDEQTITLVEVMAELRALRADVRQLLQARDLAAAEEEAAKLADEISGRSPARGDR